MNTYVNDNLNDAAENQVNTTHAVVIHWRDNALSTSGWNDLYVATPTSHMVAQDQINAQYFGRLFNVRYADGCGEHQGWEYLDTKVYNMGGSYATEESIINTVGKHFIDEPMGTAFFHDAARMHHDALMDGATLACNKIFGENTLYYAESDSSDSGEDTWKTIAIVFIVSFLISIVTLVCGYRFMSKNVNVDSLSDSSGNGNGDRKNKGSDTYTEVSNLSESACNIEMEVQKSPMAAMASGSGVGSGVGDDSI